MSYFTLDHLKANMDELEIAEEAFGYKAMRALQTNKIALNNQMFTQKKYFNNRLSKCHSEEDIIQLRMWINKNRDAIQRKINGKEIRHKETLSKFLTLYDEFERKLDSMSPAEEKLSTRILDKPTGKTMVLYHGSDKKFDYVKAGSVNMGNRLEPKHLSSFWAKSFDYAVVYAFDWMCIETQIPYTHDLSDITLVVPNLVNSKTGEGITEFMKKEINTRPLYVYEAEIPIKYIGRGHVPINEYTVDRDVLPRRVIELKWNDVKKYVKVVTQDEFNEMKNKYVFSKGDLNWKEKLIFRNPKKTLAKRAANFNSYNQYLTFKRRLFFDKGLKSK